jgi:hypothetical protein
MTAQREDWVDNIGEKVDAAFLNGQGAAINANTDAVAAATTALDAWDVQAASVATSESPATASYGDLTTTTDTATVTVAASGKVQVSIYVQGTCPANNGGFASFALSGANTLAATDARSLETISDVFGRSLSGTFMLTGLTPGSTTFKLKYRRYSSNHTVAFANRHISVIAFP